MSIHYRTYRDQDIDEGWLAKQVTEELGLDHEPEVTIPGDRLVNISHRDLVRISDEDRAKIEALIDAHKPLTTAFARIGYVELPDDGFIDVPDGDPIRSEKVSEPQNLTIDWEARDNNIYVNASWDPPSDASDPDSVKYDVRLYEVVNDTEFPVRLESRLEQTSITFDDARNMMTYRIYVRARASDVAPRSEWVEAETDTGQDDTPPEQVEGVEASAAFNSVTVTWDEVSDDDVRNGNGEYQIQLAQSDDFTAVLQDRKVSGTILSFSDVEEDTTYYVRVRAIDFFGNEGDWSDVASATTASAPTRDFEEDPITETEIDDDSISTPKLQANAVEAGKIAADAVTAREIVGGSITADEITADGLEANEILTGFIDAEDVDVINLDADNISAGTISADRVETLSVQAGHVSIENGEITNAMIESLDADKLTAGTINANFIDVINLDADNITAGSISADRIDGGTLGSTTQDLRIVASGWVEIDDTPLSVEGNNPEIRAYARGSLSEAVVEAVHDGTSSWSSDPEAVVRAKQEGGDAVFIGENHRGNGLRVGRDNGSTIRFYGDHMRVLQGTGNTNYADIHAAEIHADEIHADEFNQTSSERLKEDIEDLTLDASYTDALDQIRVATYKKKIPEDEIDEEVIERMRNKPRQLGVIAESLPELTQKWYGPEDDEEGVMGYNQGALIAFVMQVCKEQEVRIKALEGSDG